MKNQSERRAYSYAQAVEAGLDLSSYDWIGLPDGPIEVVLDFRVWGKRASLGCFFTSLSDGKRYKLNAFPPRGMSGSTYSPKDGGIDMSLPGLDGNRFLIETRKNSKGNSGWQSAVLIES